MEGIKDLARPAKILTEDVISLHYSVSPTPFTHVEGAEAPICCHLVKLFEHMLSFHFHLLQWVDLVDSSVCPSSSVDAAPRGTK